MALTAAVLGTALLLFVGGADLRLMIQRTIDQRRTLLSGRIGAHLTIVDGRHAAPVTGLVRGITRRHVLVRTVGDEVRIPFDAISEVWEERCLLHRG